MVEEKDRFINQLYDDIASREQEKNEMHEEIQSLKAATGEIDVLQKCIEEERDEHKQETKRMRQE